MPQLYWDCETIWTAKRFNSGWTAPIILRGCLAIRWCRCPTTARLKACKTKFPAPIRSVFLHYLSTNCTAVCGKFKNWLSCQFLNATSLFVLKILSVKSIATQLFIQNPLEHQGRFLVIASQRSNPSPKSPFFFRWGHRGRLFFLSKKKKSLPLTG